MKKTHKMLLVLLGVIVLTVAGFQAMQPKEPEYQGRKLSEWLEGFDYAKSEEQKAQAVEALRAMGTNTWPILVDKICIATPRWKQEISVFAWNHGFDPFGNFGEDPEKINAWAAFIALKEDAYPAIPMLVQRLETVDEAGATYIFEVLANIGKAAVPELNKALASGSPVLKKRATFVLAVVGKNIDM